MSIITKVVRLKITVPIHPTSSWKVLRDIFKQLHEETRIASNKCITCCNMEYASNMDDESTFLQRKEFSKQLYRVAVSSAPSLQSYNSGSISQDIGKLYFSNNKGSYISKIKNGDGNPPMGYSKTIPIPIAYAKGFTIEKIDRTYNFSFALVSKEFKKKWNENNVNNNPNECFKLANGIFKVGIDTTSNAVKSVLDKCLSGEYKMGGSKIVNKENKYYINLTYSFDVDTTNKELISDRVLGIDLGVNNPVYMAVNYNDYTSKIVGGNYIIKQKMKYKRRLSKEQNEATILSQGGHGRRPFVQVPNEIRNKRSNYAETCNRRFAKVIVDFAVNNKCATIHMEDLSGLYKKNQKDKFLSEWTNYQLQMFVEQKALQNGVKVEYVDPRGTSQTCSCCGFKSPDNRPKGSKGAEYFKCGLCGKKMNADFNAARNIAMKEPLKKKKKCNNGE